MASVGVTTANLATEFGELEQAPEKAPEKAPEEPAPALARAAHLEADRAAAAARLQDGKRRIAEAAARRSAQLAMRTPAEVKAAREKRIAQIAATRAARTPQQVAEEHQRRVNAAYLCLKEREARKTPDQLAAEQHRMADIEARRAARSAEEVAEDQRKELRRAMRMGALSAEMCEEVYQQGVERAKEMAKVAKAALLKRRAEEGASPPKKRKTAGTRLAEEMSQLEEVLSAAGPNPEVEEKLEKLKRRAASRAFGAKLAKEWKNSADRIRQQKTREAAKTV